MAKATYLPTGFWLGALIVVGFTLLELSAFPNFHTLFSLTHVLLSLTTLLLLLIFSLRNFDLRYMVPFALFFIPFGLLGGILISLSLVLYLLDHYITQPMSSLISSLFPKKEIETSEYIYERLLYRLEDTRPERIPTPFKDIMRYGNYNQKRVAIEKMLRYFKPEFVPALKMGLEDPSSAIKVQTATALSFIDHKMFDRFTFLNNLRQEDPENPLYLKSFAEFGAYYALSGILDEDRLQNILSETIPIINSYLKKEPKEQNLKLSLAKLYLRKGERLKAKQVLEDLLKVSFEAQAAYLLMGIFYDMEDYEEVKALAKMTLKETENLEGCEYIRNMALAWGNGAHG